MIRKKPVNVFPKKRKRRVTALDAAKLHARLIAEIDRLSGVHKLSPEMQEFWRVVEGTDEPVAVQIRILNEKSGERWTRHRYMKTRGAMERRLGKS